jgi:hypothetical protein
MRRFVTMTIFGIALAFLCDGPRKVGSLLFRSAALLRSTGDLVLQVTGLVIAAELA